MDKQPLSQPQNTSNTKISADSNYGSLNTESSSSCLSLLSESDLFDEPSTSGCSSEVATMMQNREKKRQKVKEFLRELKSMVPSNQHGSNKLGTLSTLDYVVSSMRRITEEQKQEKSQVFKAPAAERTALPSLQCPESVDFRNVNDGIILNTQSDLTVAVSLKNHVVLHTSTELMDVLGYPAAWWKGRLLKDFVHKKDIMTVSRYISSGAPDGETSATEPRSQSKRDGPKQQKQFFYARVRRFRSLSLGFAISSSGSYMPFKIMVTPKLPEAASELTSEELKMSRRGVMLYFAPMTSPYKDGHLPPEPEQRTFSLRHSLFCVYSYTHANTVPLLGFLPQDIVGTSIFEYYHPDDLPQLLDIYKKVTHSSGHPFKSGPLRIRTRNGSYVKVKTEWSSFMNPWDHSLEFIIAQHTVIKPPENPNVFEDRRSADVRLSENSRKLIEKIKEVLQKPSTFDTMPLTPSDSGGAGAVRSPKAGSSTAARDVDKTKEKVKNDSSQGPTSASDISSSGMDEKSISSLYNQVNYSLNIKRFLLSHPKAFPVSDEDSSTDVVQKEDSEEDMNEEEEMQVEIPVVRPPSCGSSTQVHVSEQGFHEEVPSPPSFSGEDPSLTRETVDNQLMLTEASLRKHTKAQELLYLQEASKEQPHLFHLKSRRTVGQRCRQKRIRSSGHEQTTDVFKFARNTKGQRGAGTSGGAGLFMSNFPITAVDVKPTLTQPVSQGMTTQTHNMVGMMPGAFQPGMGMMPQLTMLPINPTTGVHLQPHMQPFLPTPSSNMQWPYYPQSGYSLMPQVMAGFYQPVLQPMPLTQTPPFTDPSPCTDSSTLSHPGMQQQAHKEKEQHINRTDSDNHFSSAEDTSSSIQYLLDAASGNISSPNELETDEKMRQRPQLHPAKMPRRRQVLPPWLQIVNWTPELRLTYKLPMTKAKNVLKKDREALKKIVQMEQTKVHLETLLEEMENPDYMPAMDEEADYIFYPRSREGEGESSSRETPSPTAATRTGPAVQGKDASSSVGSGRTGRARTSSRSKQASQVNPAEQPMEVVVTEELLEPVLDETTDEAMNISESLEKVHSPASEGSNSSGKEGSTEGSAGSPTPCALGAEAGKSALERKDASSDDGRSDVGSDKFSENSSNNSRQKNEDAQSFSSNLTPSEERSTEDARSSMKESEMSTPKGSVMSSNDKMSSDSGAESASPSVCTLKPDLLEKLFVPLKVLMSHSDSISQPNKVMALPFWQQEAHMTEDVAMKFSLKTSDLNTILANDRRRLSKMHQPHKVNCQLLELLQEVEGQGHKGGSSREAWAQGDALGGSVTRLGEPSSSSSAAKFMQPLSIEQSRSSSSSSNAHKVKGTSVSSRDNPHFDRKECASKSGPTACVEKQILDKLQSMTPGQHMEECPGDIIMNKVFLPVDLVGSQAATGTTDQSQDAEILNSVD